MLNFSKKIRNIYQHKNSLAFILSRLIPMSGLNRAFTIDRKGYRLRFHNSALSKRIFADRNFGLDQIEILARLIDPGDIVYDIGANIGDYVLAAASRTGPEGLVYAFEPHPRVMGYLRDNIGLNGFANVRTAQLAVGDSFGWVSFTDLRGDTVNHVVPGGTIHVPMVRLDAFISEPVVRVIKIDVEGLEMSVIKGMDSALPRVRYIMFEAQDAQYARYNSSFAQIYDFLSEYGYEIFDFDKRRLLRASRSSSFPHFRNLIACRDVEDLRMRMQGYAEVDVDARNRAEPVRTMVTS